MSWTGPRAGSPRGQCPPRSGPHSPACCGPQWHLALGSKICPGRAPADQSQPGGAPAAVVTPVRAACTRGKPQHGACGHAEVRHPRKSWRQEPAPEGVSGLGLEGDVSGPLCGSTPLACRHLAMLSHSHVVIQPRSLNSMEGKRPTTQGLCLRCCPGVPRIWGSWWSWWLGQGEGWQEGPLCLLFFLFFFFFFLPGGVFQGGHWFGTQPEPSKLGVGGFPGGVAWVGAKVPFSGLGFLLHKSTREVVTEPTCFLANSSTHTFIAWVQATRAYVSLASPAL